MAVSLLLPLPLTNSHLGSKCNVMWCRAGAENSGQSEAKQSLRKRDSRASCQASISVPLSLQRLRFWNSSGVYLDTLGLEGMEEKEG